jgi:hypothetical protein
VVPPSWIFVQGLRVILESLALHLHLPSTTVAQSDLPLAERIILKFDTAGLKAAADSKIADVKTDKSKSVTFSDVMGNQNFWAVYQPSLDGAHAVFVSDPSPGSREFIRRTFVERYGC